MNCNITKLATVAMLTALPLSIHAQTAYTDPVGAMVVDLTAGADNIIAIPFEKNQVFQGVPDSVTDLAGDSFQINFASTVSDAAANAWANFYYVRFIDGAAQGKYFTITASSDSAVTIDTLNDDLSAVTAADSFEIQEYWTLGTLLPAATQDSLVVSTGNLAFQRGSEVFLPDISGTGINRASGAKFFVTASEWRAASGFGKSDDVILYPDSFIIIRQKSTAGSKSLVLSGGVPMSPQTANIFQETIKNDNYLALQRPIPVTLAELNLGSNFTDSSGNLAFQRKDELLIWETTGQLNPSASRKFFRVSGQWRDADGFGVADNYVINPTTAFIIRKNSQSESVTLYWTNNRNYLND